MIEYMKASVLRNDIDGGGGELRIESPAYSDLLFTFRVDGKDYAFQVSIFRFVNAIKNVLPEYVYKRFFEREKKKK